MKADDDLDAQLLQEAFEITWRGIGGKAARGCDCELCRSEKTGFTYGFIAGVSSALEAVRAGHTPDRLEAATKALVATLGVKERE